MLDARAPAREDPFPDTGVIIDSNIVAQNIATPAVVIAGDHQYFRPRFLKLSEFRENAKARSRNDRPPFEPELKEIAIDHERASAVSQLAEEFQDVTFDRWLGEAEVQVGNDVAWRREHALILATGLRLYKPRRAVQSSRTLPMSSDSPCTPRSLTHEIELRVRYAETDQMGVVYHANYLVWCEMGRTDLIRQLGVSYADMERGGILLAVSELSARFHAAARYDDLIRVHTTLADIRSRMIRFEYVVSNATSNQRLVSATTTLVSLDRNGRPIALPVEFRDLFR